MSAGAPFSPLNQRLGADGRARAPTGGGDVQGSARKDVVFGAARVYTVAVPVPKWKSWLKAGPAKNGGSNVKAVRRTLLRSHGSPILTVPGWPKRKSWLRVRLLCLGLESNPLVMRVGRACLISTDGTQVHEDNLALAAGWRVAVVTPVMKSKRHPTRRIRIDPGPTSLVLRVRPDAKPLTRAYRPASWRSPGASPSACGREGPQ